MKFHWKAKIRTATKPKGWTNRGKEPKPTQKYTKQAFAYSK